MWPDDTAHSPICPGLLTPCKPEEAQIVTLVWLRRHSRPWCSLKPQRSYVPYDPLRMWECSDCMNAQLGISQSVINVSPFYPLFSWEITSHFDLKSWHGLCTTVISPPFLWSPFCISLGDPRICKSPTCLSDYNTICIIFKNNFLTLKSFPWHNLAWALTDWWSFYNHNLSDTLRKNTMYISQIILMLFH